MRGCVKRAARLRESRLPRGGVPAAGAVLVAGPVGVDAGGAPRRQPRRPPQRRRHPLATDAVTTAARGTAAPERAVAEAVVVVVGQFVRRRLVTVSEDIKVYISTITKSSVSRRGHL